MKRIDSLFIRVLIHIILLSPFANGVTLGQSPDECPWKPLTGNWTFSDDSGYTADVRFKLTDSGDSSIGIWRDKDGVYTELAGWRPEEKTLVVNGHGTNGAYWKVVFDQVEESTVAGDIIDRRADGTIYEGKWQLKRESDELLTTLFVGKDGQADQGEVLP